MKFERPLVDAASPYRRDGRRTLGRIQIDSYLCGIYCRFLWWPVRVRFIWSAHHGAALCERETARFRLQRSLWKPPSACLSAVWNVSAFTLCLRASFKGCPVSRHRREVQGRNKSARHRRCGAGRRGLPSAGGERTPLCVELDHINSLTHYINGRGTTATWIKRPGSGGSSRPWLSINP